MATRTSVWDMSVDSDRWREELVVDSAGARLATWSSGFRNMLVSIVMARLIAPEQFGVFAVALTVWMVLSSLAEFGLGADLIRAQDIARRIPTVATMGVLISTALAIVMMLSAAPLAAAFDSPESTGVIRLMSLSLIIVGLSIVPAAILKKRD